MKDLDEFDEAALREGAEDFAGSSPSPSGRGSFADSCFCRLGEHWVLYHPLEDRLLVLNGTAKIVWDLLDQGWRAPDIASQFARQFGIAEEQAAHDVGLVLADLSHGRPSAEHNRARPGLWGDGPVSPDTRQDGPADCGAFRFGQHRIRVLSSVAGLDSAFFLRFRHRALANGSDELEISPDGGGYRLTFCGEIVAEVQAIGQIAARLIDLLLSLEHRGKPMLAFCHAAAVSRAGRSLLMPGSSGTGKSTLTAFLVANGFAYLGDDLVAIGSEGMALLPLPTSLSIKAGSWPILESLYPVLPDLATLHRYGRSIRYLEPRGHYAALEAANAPAAIVFPAYCEGAATSLQALPPVETMIRLLGAHARLSHPGSAAKLAELIHFVERTPAYQLSYGDLPSAMSAIENLLAADVAASQAT